ncbi:unnamed protein product [Polarella glacialis]|uniref:SET domain-containing protein n=1 Tax=Polarella glacialis TaxID=89957 RepID=A0A813LNW1_POLGL|nr:unnamed protein product [Polarella glacialis]
MAWFRSCRPRPRTACGLRLAGAEELSSPRESLGERQASDAEEPEAKARREVKGLCEENGSGYQWYIYWAAIRSLTEAELGGATGFWPPITEDSQALLLLLHQPEHLASRSAGRVPLAGLPEAWSTEIGETVDMTVVRLARHFGLKPGCVQKLQALCHVWQYNSFQLGTEFAAVYFGASFCSHSCKPNCFWVIDETGNWVLHVKDDLIQEGEEVTISYLCSEKLELVTFERRELLARNWLFFCSCSRCAEKPPPQCVKCSGIGGSPMEVVISAANDGPYDGFSTTCDLCAKEELTNHHGYYFHCSCPREYDLCPSCGETQGGDVS